MKIIISRKGFDNANGKCASPILPDGDMVSMPIPTEESSGLKFEEIFYQGRTYAQMCKELSEKAYHLYPSGFCHLDPDIREDIRSEKIPGWKSAFGQTGAAQGYLQGQNVDVGDIFLFFGTFHQTEEKDGKLSYCRGRRGKSVDFYVKSDLHIIYGYLQVGEIITDPGRIKREYPWHPHSRFSDKNNVLYIPADKLIINGEDQGVKGYGVLNYDKKRVLTKEGRSKGNWIKRVFYMPENVAGNRKNSSKSEDALYYAGIWQEIVLKDTTEELIDWVKELILS